MVALSALAVRPPVLAASTTAFLNSAIALALSGANASRLSFSTPVSDGINCLTDLDSGWRASRGRDVLVGHVVLCQSPLGDIARAGEVDRTCDGATLEGALCWIRSDHDGNCLLRSDQLGVGIAQQHGEHGEVSQCSQQAATHDDGLAADLVRQGTKHDEERRADDQRSSDQQVGGLGVHLGNAMVRKNKA